MVVAAALASVLSGSVGPADAGVARPKRIVSLNACADDFLIALADKGQVAALTQYARDPSLSFYADRARSYPTTRGEAEAVLALHPDLVFASAFGDADTLAMLKGRVRVVDLPLVTSFDDVVRETRQVAAAIGQPARGEALVRTMTARVNAAGRRPLHGVAAEYQRGGYVTGPGSLMDDLMTRAGLVNLMRRQGGGAFGQMPLEAIVYARPDYLILTDGRSAGQDEGGLTLEHPALLSAVPEAKRLHIPSALVSCGGPSYPDALERLQAEADRARGRH